MFKKFVLWLLKMADTKLHEKLFDKSHEESIAQVERLVESAKEATEKAICRNFTKLEQFDVDSAEYLSAISDIWESKQFAWFIEIHKTEIISLMLEGNEKSAVEAQGMLKGIDYIMKNILSAKRKYDQIRNSRNIDL